MSAREAGAVAAERLGPLAEEVEVGVEAVEGGEQDVEALLLGAARPMATSRSGGAGGRARPRPAAARPAASGARSHVATPEPLLRLGPQRLAHHADHRRPAAAPTGPGRSIGPRARCTSLPWRVTTSGRAGERRRRARRPGRRGTTSGRAARRAAPAATSRHDAPGEGAEEQRHQREAGPPTHRLQQPAPVGQHLGGVRARSGSGGRGRRRAPRRRAAPASCGATTWTSSAGRDQRRSPGRARTAPRRPPPAAGTTTSGAGPAPAAR